MKRRDLISSILGAGLMALAVIPASASPYGSRADRLNSDYQRVERVQNRGVRSNFEAPILMAAVKISASQAKSIALRHVRGSSYLDIKLIGGNTYRVRVMKDGRRIDVFVDANTGRVR